MMKSLLVLYSYHNNNTEKIANVMAKVLDAVIIQPRQLDTRDLRTYDLVGFGSGIYGEKHHSSLLEVADNLLPVDKKRAFLFSTSGVPWGFPGFHTPLRERLQQKGYVIIDEFNCVGLNTNSFLKLFRGMNKGRPNREDLKKAEMLAKRLKLSTSSSHVWTNNVQGENISTPGVSLFRYLEHLVLFQKKLNIVGFSSGVH